MEAAALSSAPTIMSTRASLLEELYHRYNRPEWIGLDPLALVRTFRNIHDREIVALLAAALAYGRVVQIHRSVAGLLQRIESPAAQVDADSRSSLRRALRGFRHRFASEDDVFHLLWGVRGVRREHGSLGRALAAGMNPDAGTVLSALSNLVRQIRNASGGAPSHLLPSPENGSACKRLLLFLRWMVRCDAVDPGGFDHVSPRLLVMPLDVHGFRLARALGLTRRKAADLKAALEVTDAFRKFAPEDPVRYDFALTRLGIRGDLEPHGFLAQWQQANG